MGMWDGYALALAVVASVSFYATSLLAGVREEEGTSGLREEGALPRMAVAAMLRSSEPSMIRDGRRFFVISKTVGRVAERGSDGVPADYADGPDDRPRYHTPSQGPFAVFQEDEVELRLTRGPGDGAGGTELGQGLMLEVETVGSDEVIRFQAPGPQDEDAYVEGVARLIQYADDFASERAARGRLNLPLFGHEPVDGGAWPAEVALRAIARAVHRVRPLNVIPTVHVGTDVEWDVLRPHVNVFTVASYIPPPYSSMSGGGVGADMALGAAGAFASGVLEPVAEGVLDGKAGARARGVATAVAKGVLDGGVPAACNAACVAALGEMHVGDAALRGLSGAVAGVRAARRGGVASVAEALPMTLDREADMMYSAVPRTAGQALYVVRQMNLIGDVDNLTFVTAPADGDYDTTGVVAALRRINVASRFAPAPEDAGSGTESEGAGTESGSEPEAETESETEGAGTESGSEDTGSEPEAETESETESES